MPLSMYQASIPVFERGFANLKAIIDKGRTHAEAKKIDPSVFINARLAPDMLPFSRQIQIATDVTKGFAGRLAGVDVPSFADTETTFPELHARIGKTLDFFRTVKAEQIDGSEEKTVTLKIGDKNVDFKGQAYLLGFVLPNLYFHITVAYSILRHNGVELGKMDFLGKP